MFMNVTSAEFSEITKLWGDPVVDLDAAIAFMCSRYGCVRRCLYHLVVRRGVESVPDDERFEPYSEEKRRERARQANDEQRMLSVVDRWRAK